MLFGKRQSLWIINIYKTFFMLKLALNMVKFFINCYSPIWFINLDKTVSSIIKKAARICGEFCFHSFWINGAITNYENVKLRLTSLFILKK